jgi:hypothetical protein
MTTIGPPVPTVGSGNNIGLYGQTGSSSIVNVSTDNYSNANVANYLPNYSGFIGGTLTTAQAQLVLGGNLNANSFWINNLRDPLQPQDGATKAYVDAQTANGGGKTYYGGMGIVLSGANSAYIDANVDDVNIIINGSNEIAITTQPTFANVTATNFFGTATAAQTATTATRAGTVTTNAHPNITSVGTLTSLTSSGNVTAGFFIGNGSQLTGVIVSNTANANYSNFSGIAAVANSVAGANVTGQVTSALFAGQVYNSEQPTITSVGTLNDLTVNSSNSIYLISGGILSVVLDVDSNIVSINQNANIDVGGNIITPGKITSSGNITASPGGYFIGDGGLLSNISGGGGNYSNANVANYLPTYGGNIAANNITVTGNVVGNVNGLVHGIDIRYLVFDFAYLQPNTYNNPIQYLLATAGTGNVEFGTFSAPASLNIDFGTL